MSFTQNTNATREETHVCAECGAEFTRVVKAKALTGKNHFCSRKCSRAFYHRKERKGVEFAEHTGICRHCGKPFTFKVESYKKECFWPHYCQEPECQAERRLHQADTTKQAIARWHQRNRKNAEKIEYRRVCRNCGKEFVVMAAPGTPEKFLRKCCSDECSKAFDKKLDYIYNRTVKKGLPREDVGSMSHSEVDAYMKRLASQVKLTKAVCECCGREFEYDVRHAGFGHNRKYCSEECKVKGTYARLARERHAKSNHEVECSVCHKKFWSIYPTAKYCSKECKHVGSHPDVYLNPDGTRKEKAVFERECPACHKVFATNNAKKLYCSDACRRSAYKRGDGIEVVSQDRPVYDKTCPECGKAFQTNVSRKRFCSDRCRHRFFQKKDAAPKKTVTRVCRQCGKEFSFEVPATSSEKFWPKTCSAECRKAWNDAHPNAFKWQGRPKKEPKTLVCERCGKEFSTTRYSGPNAQRFCSKECRLAAIYEKTLAAHRKPRVTIRCEVCGKEFEIPEGARRKYCSKACKRAAEYRKKGYVPKDPVAKTCRHCGKEFLTRNPYQMYCGKECKDAYHAAHPTEYKYLPKPPPGPRKCECCGREFVPGRTHPNARFCSKGCQKTAYQKVHRRKYVPKPAPEPKTCRWCGAVFVPSKSHPTAEFCKYDHARRFRYHGNRSEVQVAYDRAEALTHVSPGGKRPKLAYAVVRKCRKCGKEFTAATPGQFYCSAECKPADRRKAVPTLRKCKVCGKEFMGVGKQTTCSKECAYVNRSRWSTLQNGPRRAAVEKVRVVCAECGQEFEYERKGRMPLRKYCSDACCRKYWNRYMAELNKEATAERKAARDLARAEELAEKARLAELRKAELAEIRSAKAAAKEAEKAKRAELREKIRAMKEMDAERRKAEKAAMREEIAKHREQKRLLAQIERAEREAARKEAAEAERVRRAEERKTMRIRKSEERKAEKAKERAERLKAHEEERMARILAVREKRRLVKEESARLRAENLAKRAEKMKESAERRRKTAAESAAKKRAAARAKADAERAILVAKAREEGRKVETAVCKECGREFEYVPEYLTGVKPGTVPMFCCHGCKDHWKYEHGGKEKAKAYQEKLKAEGGRWNGRHFEKGKKKEDFRVTWRGQHSGFCGGGSGTSWSPDGALSPEDIRIENPEEAFEYDE